MVGHAHQRQILFFLAAVLFPCAAVVVLGVRLAVQEQELSVARLGEERRGLARALRQELSSDLERMALRQTEALAANPERLHGAEYDDPTVALVATVSDGQLVLPWERDRGLVEVRRLLGGGAFNELIRTAERVEFTGRDPSSAAELYRRALKVASHPVQAAHARLYLARNLARAGRKDAAVAEYRAVSAVPPDVVDDNGVPLSLYAASRLLALGAVDTTTLQCVHDALSNGRWLSPAALYLLRDLADRSVEAEAGSGPGPAAEWLARDVSAFLARTEQALDLKRVFPRLGLTWVASASAAGRRRWVLHGSPPWLVGTAPPAEGEPALVVAVRAEPLLAALESGVSASPEVKAEVVVDGVTTPGRGGEVEPLGAGFPGLSVRFASLDGQGVVAVRTARWWFYVAGLSLVLGVTFFGAYLLWRDVRREVALAETRSRFVSAVSHEFKTPLSAIRMFAESLQMGRPADPDARSEYLDTIVNESERLTRLLNNVLDFSRIEEGRKAYRREESHSLAEIVRSSARAMRYPLEQQQFELCVDVDEEVPPTRVDRDAIEQAILNLLANAVKYSGESRAIDLRLMSRDGEAVIEVTDRGFGIEAGEHQRIFERFYRVDATDRNIPGTGLGLTLVRHVAEAHGGRVAVRSAPGEGSTFSLFIPLDTPIEGVES